MYIVDNKDPQYLPPEWQPTTTRVAKVGENEAQPN